MNRKIVFALVAVVVVIVVVGASCATKAGPDESPVTGEHDERTIPWAVHGAVRTVDGNAVVGVMVSAVSIEDPARPVPEVAVITDEHGGYEWPLPPGRYRLSVDSPAGSGSGEVKVRVDQENALDITVT